MPLRILIFIIMALLPRLDFAQSLTVSDAIQKARTSNPDILEARERLQSTRALFWSRISPEYPELFFEIEGVPESSNDLNRWSEKKIGITQPLNNPLSFYFTAEMNKKQIEQAQMTFQMTENRVIRQVKDGFYRVIQLEQTLKILEETRRLAEELFRKAAIRVMSGEATSYDSLKAKVDLMEIENRLLAGKQNLDAAKHACFQMMGMHDEPSLQFQGQMTFEPVKADLETLYAMAESQHPLLRRVDAEVGETRSIRNLAWASLLPSFSIRYFKQSIRGERTEHYWGGELGLSIPLWFFMKGQGDIRAAHHQVHAAQWHARSVRQVLRRNVFEAHSALLVAQKHVSNFQEGAVLSVEELVRIASRSYEEGEMGYLEWAEAMQAYLRVNEGYLKALYDFQTARSGLEEAVGNQSL